MKKYIITGLFTGLMSLASFVFAEEAEESTIEPIQVVCPAAEEETALSSSDTTAEATTEENK